jgi:hypothetical protein
MLLPDETSRIWKALNDTKRHPRRKCVLVWNLPYHIERATIPPRFRHSVLSSCFLQPSCGTESCLDLLVDCVVSPVQHLPSPFWPSKL